MSLLRGISSTALLVMISAILLCRETSLAYSDDHVSSIIRTTSKKSLLHALEAASKMQRAKKGCVTELSLKAIPVSCFEQLHLENASGHRSVAQIEKQRERLTRICADRVKTVTSWEHLKQVIRSAEVSENCRSKSRERLDDLYYQAETDAPSRLFQENGPDFD